MISCSSRNRACRAHCMRLTRVSLLLLCVLSLTAPSVTAGPVGGWHVPGLATKLYIGQAARLTARIPATWAVPPDSDAIDYAGPSGFVVSQPVAAANLDAACAKVASGDVDPVIERTTWQEKPACMFDEPTDVALGGRASRTIVLAHPLPFHANGNDYGFAELATDPAHFNQILSSLSFAPERVTPQAYVASVLDVIQARSLFRDKLDWPEARELALEQDTTWAAAHAELGVIMGELRAVGDHHSAYVSSDVLTSLNFTPTGFGLFLLGQRVLQVNAGGPAARAGIEAGDQIVAVDGREIVGPDPPADLSTIAAQETTVIVTVQPVQGGPARNVTLQRTTYSTYLPPTGSRLDGNLGYLQLFWSLDRNHAAEYARTGQKLMARIERQPTCGWIIDLRSDLGGGTPPMLQAVGSLLANGRIFGFQSADGAETWATFRAGGFYKGGQPFWRSVPARPSPGPDLSQMPVALLVGPDTASAAELAAISFIGRPATRLIGSATAGFTSANAFYELFDGYSLVLAESYEMDRAGTVYTGPIMPDEHVQPSTVDFGTPEDATLNAAESWLHQQPSCQQVHASAIPSH